MAKLLVNLHSAQTIPNYIAIKEFRPDIVIALATDQYNNQVEIFEKHTNVEHVSKNIDAYDIDKNFEIIAGLVSEFSPDDEIIINYTGGTKVMVLSVILKILLSTNKRLQFIYVNTYGNNIEVLELSEDKRLTTYHKEIETKIYLETYVNLNGEKLKSIQHKPTEIALERIQLSEALLTDKKLSKIFNMQKTFFERKKEGKRNINVPKKSNVLNNQNFELSWNDENILLTTSDDRFEYKHSDGGVYFTGGWLEEYVFVKLYNSDSLHKVVANVKFNFTSFKVPKGEIFKNEMDVVATKGLKTAFVECKAGNVTQDYVYKLKSIKDHFLGTFGVAVLVTKFHQPKNIIEKCKDAGITIISGTDIQIIDKILEEII